MVPWWMWVVGGLGVVTAIISWWMTRDISKDEGVGSHEDRHWYR